MELEKQMIYDYIRSNLLYGDLSYELNDHDSLIDSGILDSVAVLEFVDFLENQFQIEINEQDFVKENFDTVHSILSFISKRRATLSSHS